MILKNNKHDDEIHFQDSACIRNKLIKFFPQAHFLQIFIVEGENCKSVQFFFLFTCRDEIAFHLKTCQILKYPKLISTCYFVGLMMKRL